MKENHIIISKTARYFTLGELNDSIRHVCFVLHGFGQQAGTFLQQFESLAHQDVFFIAPEALNRFYLKGNGGAVGATWMTKEDRLNEIKDYIHYLDELYEFFEFEKFPIHITALGFSQGASTITRWANATEHRIDTLIVYAGEVAPELLPVHPSSGLLRTRNIFIYGNRDEYFSTETIAQMKTIYTPLHFTEIEFDGTHIIQPELLQPFLK